MKQNKCGWWAIFLSMRLWKYDKYSFHSDTERGVRSKEHLGVKQWINLIVPAWILTPWSYAYLAILYSLQMCRNGCDLHNLMWQLIFLFKNLKCTTVPYSLNMSCIIFKACEVLFVTTSILHRIRVTAGQTIYFLDIVFSFQWSCESLEPSTFWQRYRPRLVGRGALLRQWAHFGAVSKKCLGRAQLSALWGCWSVLQSSYR